jgi:superfamily II DNA helicase RecQ
MAKKKTEKALKAIEREVKKALHKDATEAGVGDAVDVVQRTGWGKSVVYFLATRLLRDRGAGPTLLISPLLSLMRNQIMAAENIGVRADTINSTNLENWPRIEGGLRRNEFDASSSPRNAWQMMTSSRVV